MFNFYPGPSKVYEEVREYLQDAYDEGVLSIPHRGERFVQLSRATVELLKKKLNIPQDYYVFFASSATECWEIVTQSLAPTKSYHIYNGSFGEKWCQYAKKLRPLSQGFAYDINEPLPVDQLEVDKATDVICITQNETSNGTQIRNGSILNLFNKYRDKLIAVDATSSMAGVNLKFIKADVWFASVQKCFGLPAGLAVLVCSPRAIFRAKQHNEKAHYNSLVFMYEKMLNYQTTHTPNVLNIYLLNRVLENRPLIKTVDQHTVRRAQELYQFFSELGKFKLLIENEEVRSNTVLALEGSEKAITEVKAKAAQHNLTLGNGYGQWAKSTFRIANFPAIQAEEYDALKNFFLRFYA
ncbi:MAG: aminotransferase class V-fold PLP-dependent enzyme [Hymenobacteraceae bacterium]|nr:aminotransferase class V-fold PLP-dependent enzyme [Hymenobacteraceae bacterium]MDX5397669.1 aminotransferase class V-fold PLP-dependent enzyme [Hymenobacteraceae bacterium]MDX5443250.1 aminotransferase class V-fold PLP-dependent enzyme [Hymenobacteraceae bacterium]MDX5513745.1 aminotransferase class V-fold PLP-dependent enzyme [Hymenobacteraceae bacterium]